MFGGILQALEQSSPSAILGFTIIEMPIILERRTFHPMDENNGAADAPAHPPLFAFAIVSSKLQLRQRQCIERPTHPSRP